MYSVLSKRQSQVLNQEASLKISITADKKNPDNKYLTSPVYVNLGTDDEDTPILSFYDSGIADIMTVFRLKRIKNAITDTDSIFEALCRRALIRFEFYAKKHKNKKLVIYTDDGMIFEILLERGYSIELICDSRKYGYEATKEIKQKEQIDV